MSQPKLEKRRQHFRLYIAGGSLKSIKAKNNIQALLRTHLGDGYELEVIDVFETPQFAEADRVVAVPLLIRTQPQPIRRLLGDFSKYEDVCHILGFNDAGGDYRQ